MVQLVSDYAAKNICTMHAVVIDAENVCDILHYYI